MKQAGLLHKMKNEWVNATTPLKYTLRLGEEGFPLNDVIGKKARLFFTGKMQCIHCGRSLKKTFQQGYCYPCTIKLAETDVCIVKPELCHHHKGTCRDNDFAQKHCFIPHVVYLAISSDAKVGITRAHQKLNRWADQGAVSAVELAMVSNRQMAGFIEVEMAKHLQDKTNWRKMLTDVKSDLDLVALKQTLAEKLAPAHKEFLSPNDEVYHLLYPVNRYPAKISSYNLDKNPVIEDTLMGIKGQYLIFEHGVINVRKYQGYEVEFSVK